MGPLPQTSIGEHFATLTDPRTARGREHRLVDILTITLCAVICGADDWVAVATFGRDEGGLAADVPGAAGRHPVARHVRAGVRLLDPDEFRRCFLSWVQAVVGGVGGGRGAGRPGTAGRGGRRQDAAAVARSALRQGRRCIWSAPGRPTSGLVLGQVATDAKSNEITAIPALLQLLALEGATVTIDAMGCQTAIARQIVEQRADYVLALKDNHRAAARAGRVWPSSRPTRPRHDPAAGRPARPTRPSRRTTGASSSAAAGPSATRPTSPTSIPTTPGPTSRASSASSRPAASATRSRPRRATTSPACPPTPRCSAESSAATGASRTASTGSSTSPSTRTAAASAPITPPRTSPSSATSPSISCAATPPDASASRTPASRPPSTTPISAPSSSARAPD